MATLYLIAFSFIPLGTMNELINPHGVMWGLGITEFFVKATMKDKK